MIAQNAEGPEFIQKILDIAEGPKVIEVNGREFLAVPGSWVAKEDITAARPLAAITLQAVVDFVLRVAPLDLGEPNEALVVHVANASQVDVFSSLDSALRREYFLAAAVAGAAPNDLLPLKTWLDPAKMILGLLVVMEQTKGRDDLIAILSNLKDGRVIEAVDDGISQGITVRTGATLAGEKSLRSGVVLRPRWTFGEIQQPDVNFVVRARSGEGETLPSFSLTLADVTWQAKTVLAIRDWLTLKLGDKAVVIA